jgi:hypothetical protein
LVLAGALFLAGAFASWTDTSTGIDLDKLPHPSLVRIRSGYLREGARVTFDGIAATTPPAGGPREVQLRGVGKSGRPWLAHMCCLDEVWRTDLDGNGTQDYIFFSAGPIFNGRTTPEFSLSILLMDTEGLPVPFFTVVYQGENGKGIRNLVDLNRDGHSELLIATYDEAVSDPRFGPFCSGHWATQLYQFQNLRAEEFRGTMGGITFPFVHPWSYFGSMCPKSEKPFKIQAPTIYEHGTALKDEVSTVIRGRNDNEMSLEISPVAGCHAIRESVVVYDRPKVREIALPNLWSSAVSDLLDNIRRDGAPVRLSGLDRWPGHGVCSANLVWASAQENR